MPPTLGYAFGPYLLDIHEGTLRRHGRRIKVEPLTYDVLVVLVTRANKFVSKDTLLKEVWLHRGTYVTKSSVYLQIHKLRREVLAEDINRTVGILNRHNLGYKLIADVEPISTYPSEAEQFYVEGRHLLTQSTARSVRLAIERFTKATELDPRHARAYAALADSWVLAGTFGHQSEAPAVAMPNAEQAAKRAVSLDKTLVEAQAALASVQALYWWDWKRAERKFRRAVKVSLNPMLRAWYALCLAAHGEHKRAQGEIEDAVRRDPGSFVLKALRGRVYYLDRQYRRAAAECARAIEMHEYFYLGYLFLGHTLRQQRRFDEAARAFQIAAQLTHEHPTTVAELGHIQALTGDPTPAVQALARLEAEARTQYVSPYLFAHLYLGLGEHDKVFEYLEQTFRERGAYLVFLSTDPVYDSLRGDVRFADLARRINFTR